MATLVMTTTSGATTFVESSRPPIPTSTTATSTAARSMARNAITVAASKNDGASASTWGQSARAAVRSSDSGIGCPSIRIRSRKSTRCGEV